MSCYDEAGLLAETATEFGLAVDPLPSLRRVLHGAVSGLLWGSAPPELVLLHGGGQNAHTWDAVALALGRPLLALDLPGHGHSDWRDDADYSPAAVAPAVAEAVETLAPSSRLLVGMSLGGVTALAVAALRPEVAPKLALVDVTPGVDHERAAPIAAFIAGRQRFESFDDLLAYTVAGNPTRSEASLRRGVLHNAREEPDGSWVWRHHFGNLGSDWEPRSMGFDGLWEALGSHSGAFMLVRGGLSPVVGDADLKELLRRRPDARVEAVEGAGHSIQGDRPLELAALLEDFLG